MWHAWGREKVNTGFLVETPVGKRPLGKARCRWEDYIKMGLQEVEWGT
jgi:hypothetical protein